ncbi:uncharacterized protein BDW43DRAFT_308275 [Aspergillus alliaceus]|uniref:uncharacterized protein n=1 Tax=Petromyces alliaceus TaxID=209559 RepID=UPI0012A47AF9|nr:uncharacterized protein BDW43DRAFT_308275 [Aspergillus alliaceus]KAB8236598.1 hypothetical protein BDW43DRAFT_308275 [Aspergillus alliaceus]
MAGQGPTMIVLQAIRWAISAWGLDLSDDTIRKCFKNALSTGAIEGTCNQQPVKEIEVGLPHLQISNSVVNVMDIHSFPNPTGEEINDDLVNTDFIVLNQFATAEGPEEDEEEDDDIEWAQPPPLISISEALDGLYNLRLYEEYRVQEIETL